MKGSQELIAFFNKREEELGEKASKLCMFLEGYAEGYRDTKAYMIDMACEWLKNNYGHFDGSTEDLVADFRKAMEG